MSGAARQSALKKRAIEQPAPAPPIAVPKPARAWWLEVGATAVAFVVYCAFSGSMLLRQSAAPHFIYQAYAFLHGRLDVPRPPNMNDWVLWNGHWYVSFPPFPAVVMLPFVAINGLPFNDVFFTVCLASLNVGLFVAVLRSWRAAGKHNRKDWEIALLAAFFAFGTVYFYSSIRGEVWFTAHVVGVTLTLIYLWASLGARRPLIAGLALGCAAITRANLVFAFPFFLLELVQPWRETFSDRRAWAPKLKKLMLFGTPAAAILVLAMAMNHARWDKWTEFGHGMLYNNRVNKDVTEYGLFNVHYFWRNFQSAFLLLPTTTGSPPHVTFDGNGMSMFVTTPLLLTIPFAFERSRTAVALTVTAFVVALPGLFYMNNGWYQFGFRFSIDYLPYLFFLLAMAKVPMKGLAAALGCAGVVVNVWGALVFGR